MTLTVAAGLSLTMKSDSQQVEAGVLRVKEGVEKLQTTLAKPVPTTGVEQAITRVGTKSAEVTKLNAQQLASMQFQLQDMAVGLVSGQSPFTVMMQQGSQLAQGFTSGTGVMGALKQVGGGIVTFLTNPLNLAVVGAGLATTAIFGIASAVMSNFPSATALLERHDEMIKHIGESWDASARKVKEYSGETRNMMLNTALVQQNDERKALRTSMTDYSRMMVPIPSSGNRALDVQIAGLESAFKEQLAKGTGDVKAFLDSISEISVKSGVEGAQKLVDRIKTVYEPLLTQQEDFKQTNDVVRGLQGNTNLLNEALGRGTDKINGLTSALDKLAGTRFADIHGTTPIKASAGWTGQGTALGLAAAPEAYRGMILDAAKQYGQDPDLIARQIWQESRFNPNARSGKGAMGLMQLMPGTSGDMNVADPSDPRSNIFGGTRYMSQLMQQFAGNRELALMAYNWGQGNVRKWQQGGADPTKIPGETRDYVSSIMGGGGSISKADAAIDRKAESEKEKAAAADKRWNQIIDEGTAKLNARTEALGQSAGEQARLTREAELWSQARNTYGDRLEKDKALHAEVAKSIEGEAKAYGKLAAAAELAKAKQDAEAKMQQQRIAQMDQIREIGSGIVSTFFQAKDAGQSWGDALGGVLDGLKQKAVSFLDSFLNNMLFGQKGTENGGMFGDLLKGGMNLFNGLLQPSGGLYANGAAFAGGVEMFAGGGAFTNKVVARPTMFRFGGKLGVMGEDGPEAIMPLAAGGVAAKLGGHETRLPLTRMGNGALGVSLPQMFAAGDVFGSLPRGGSGGSGGGDLKVNVNTHNYGSDKVDTKVKRGKDGGLDIEVMVGQAVNRHLARGGADETLNGRFTGIKKRTNTYG